MNTRTETALPDIVSVAVEKPEKGRDIKSAILGSFIALLLRVINATLTWKKIGLNDEAGHWSEGSQVIKAFWHGDQLMMPWVYTPDSRPHRRKPIYALVSQHNDGRIAARTLESFGVRIIDGSSTSGAARALLQLKEKLRLGHHVAISPDGPKGPRHVAKQGPVVLSSKTGVPIFPVVVAVEKYWTLKSWDKMFIPKPFSKAIALAAEPYTVPPKLSREQLELESERLSNCLNELKQRAEAMLKKS